MSKKCEASPNSESIQTDSLAALQTLATTLRSGLCQIDKLSSTIPSATRICIRSSRERQAERQRLINAMKGADQTEIQDLISALEGLENSNNELQSVYEQIRIQRRNQRYTTLPTEYRLFGEGILADVEAAMHLDGDKRAYATREVCSSVRIALKYFEDRLQPKAKHPQQSKTTPQETKISRERGGSVVDFPHPRTGKTSTEADGTHEVLQFRQAEPADELGDLRGVKVSTTLMGKVLDARNIGGRCAANAKHLVDLVERLLEASPEEVERCREILDAPAGAARDKEGENHGDNA